MSIHQVSFSSTQETLDFISSFKMDQLVLIVPNLEFKKNLVDLLAMKTGTVPDDLVLRLSEFLSRQVKRHKPDLEFLDKKLFQIFLRQEFQRLGLAESDQYLVERSVEYISVYAPLLAHERYRTTFEEYLAEDEVFNNIYTEIYPMMSKVWDMVLGSPFLVQQWSLGWLYQNIENLTQSEMNIVIFKPESLKKVEMDFFEEMSHSWNIYSLKNSYINFSNSNSNSNSIADSGLDPKTLFDFNFENESIHKNNSEILKKFTWHKVVTPLDELELVAELISENNLKWNEVRLIIPKKRIEYVKSIEMFFTHYFKWSGVNKLKDDKLNFHTIRVFTDRVLQQIRIKKSEVNNLDLELSLLAHKDQFQSYNEFKKHTQFLVQEAQLQSINKISPIETEGKENNLNLKNLDFTKKYNFYQFIENLHDELHPFQIIDLHHDSQGSQIKNLNNELEPSENESLQSELQRSQRKESSFKSFLDWASGLIHQTPVFIELSYENWFLYLESIIQTKTEHNLAVTDLPIDFLEDIEFSPSMTYFILGCSQQNYESSNYAYLSDLEIDKLKIDLGFNFESKEFSEQLYDDFLNLKEMKLNPEIHFITPMYSLSSNKENDAKFLNELYQNNLCELSSREQSGFLSFKSTHEINLSHLSLSPVSKLKNELVSESNIEWQSFIKRKYQSASSLQKYINCPFVYFSEYVLGLKSEDDLDLEPNGMLKGNLYHNSLEKFLDQPDIKESNIWSFMKDEVNKKYNHWSDLDFIQQQLKTSSLKLQKYIYKDFHMKFTEGRKTIFKELVFECYLNIQSLKFNKKQLDLSDIKLIGKIDRVDINDDKVYILDYKLSSGKSFGDWKKDYLIQMPLYGLMFLDGVLPIEGELAQLSYIIINDEFKFKNGLSVNYKDPKYNLGLTLNRATSQSDAQALEKELNTFRDLIKQVILGISKAEFDPAPLNIKSCSKCDWKDSCHAKHLY